MRIARRIPFTLLAAWTAAIVAKFAQASRAGA
jgi:hypothetical protein